MVQKIEITNKAGEILKTKEGDILYDYILESGDLFIPQTNSIYTRKWEGEVEENGKKIKKVIKNYKLRVLVENFPNKNKEEEIFVNLTPSQANTIQKKLDNGVIITQHLFITYNYENKDGVECIGVGFKSENQKPKSFSDFQKEE